MINYAKNSIDVKKTAYLVLCLQPPADALFNLPRVCFAGAVLAISEGGTST